MGPNLRVILAALIAASLLGAAYYQGRHDGMEIGRAEGRSAVAEQMQFVAIRLSRLAKGANWTPWELSGTAPPTTQPAAPPARAVAPSAAEAEFVLDGPNP
ncbi:MAG TPA: hypothetical protein VGI81_02115 [Tepidisphaeraceae bacterium]|jgi:hypothetical protein